MSMTLEVFALSKEAFDTILADSSLVEPVLEGDAKVLKKLGITLADRADMDYLMLSEGVAGMAESIGEGDEEPVFDEEGTLGFDSGYGPAMYWSPATFKKASADTSGWEFAIGLSEEVEVFVKRAIKAKRYVVALVT